MKFALEERKCNVCRTGHWFPNAETQLPVMLSGDTLEGDMTDPAPQSARRRQGPWLFVVAVFLLLLAVGVPLSLPYYKQWNAMNEIEALGGRVEMVPAGPEWLRHRLPERYASALAYAGSVHAGNEKFDDSHLARICVLGRTEILHLGGTQVSDAGLKNLADTSNPRVLTLQGERVTDAGLRHLAGMSNLNVLFLDGTKVTDAGLKQLGALPNLDWLSLADTEISDAGLRHLCSLPNLSRLLLDETDVSDAGLRYLVRMPHLTELSLWKTHVTPEGVEKLRADLPACEIHY
ncbi:MAG: hypothetical protein CMJ48_14530 [Planctomycetaceae bacterium]|nr:hypothetical protein [Planctomycetaceae bacterium]